MASIEDVPSCCPSRRCRSRLRRSAIRFSTWRRRRNRREVIEITIDIPPPEPPPPVDLKPPPPKVVHKPPQKPPQKVVTRRPEPSRAAEPCPRGRQASGAPSPAPPVPRREPIRGPRHRGKGALLASRAPQALPARVAAPRRRGRGLSAFHHDAPGRRGRGAHRKSVGPRPARPQAVDLVRRAQPLPRPPADVPGQVFEFVVPIQFRLR